MAVNYNIYIALILLMMSAVACSTADPKTIRVVTWSDAPPTYERVKVEYYIIDDSDSTLHGPMKKYDSQGRLLSVENFSFGVKHGRYQTYWSNGHLQAEGMIDQGAYVGIHKEYSKNGQIVSEREFRNDRLWSIVGVFDRNGKKLDFGEIVAGNGFVREFDHDGNVTKQGMYREGLKEGDWEFYFPDGRLQGVGTYHGGILYSTGGHPLGRHY